MGATHSAPERGRTDARRRTQNASMADVARVAGVSSQTVSRVSNGFPGVNEETRERVLDAMKELGYRPNSAARALKRGDFRTIGVITFTLSTTGNMRTLEAIATSAAQEGYAVTLLPVAVPTQDEVRGAFSRLGELAVDAVIVIMEVHLLDSASLTLPPHVKVVVADSDAGDRYAVVDTDQAGGTGDAVRHLLGLGHRTVWHLAGPSESFAAQRRTEAWRKALEAAGRAVPRWCAATGRPIRATARACAWLNRATAPRCSRRTTRWRSACCGLWQIEAARSPRTSRSSASTTSPTLARSSRRSPQSTKTSPRSAAAAWRAHCVRSGRATRNGAPRWCRRG